ncbi:MAG: BRCT domain-containing protein [Pseudomonadota bacterium]
MHPDHREYFRFTGRSRLDKAINSLIGLVEGIAIDGSITPDEIGFLRLWLQENTDLRNRHPLNELMPVVEAAIADGVLTDDERQDILWLCEKLRSSEYFDATTADIQRLHALMAGITADGVITETELRGLSDWLAEHDQLRTCWPYDEVDSLVTTVLADGRIDANEHKLLQDFFSEFVAITDNRTIVKPKITEGTSLVGLCAICPEVSFSGTKFCFTGASSKYTRTEFSALVRQLGGDVVGSVSASLNYLVIGADGNPCWAYACYGRKVEKAVELRKQGARILLVHENDFHDAVADNA